MERIVEIFLDNGSRKLSTEEKEAIKLAIDQANNLNELLQVAFASLAIDAHRWLLRIWGVGYNLGTPALKPHKQPTKPYQNDAVLKEKPI